MASVAVGTKRTFAAIDGESPATTKVWIAEPASIGPQALEERRSPPFSQNSRDLFARAEDQLSRSSSGPPTPTPSPHTADLSRSFDPSASMVLIGIRGTGKSTLAVIASAAFQRRVVDADDSFQETTGHSSAAYRKIYGAVEHNRRQEEVLRSVLSVHDRGYIIVCSTGSMEHSGQALLREYAKTHPVIHVVRDPKSIHQYLKVSEEVKVQSLLAISGSIFRGCSNYEFYNLSESQQNLEVQHLEAQELPQDLLPGQKSLPSMTLKRAERHFLRFITLIMAKGKMPSLEPAYPLSHVSTELRKYTYAIAVPLSKLISETLDIEGLEVGADAFEVVIDDIRRPCRNAQPAWSPSSYQNLTPARADQISRTLSRVRRNTIVPIIFHVSTGTESAHADHRSIYLEHVRHGLRLAPEYATIDLSLDNDTILHILSTKGYTKMIGHFSASRDNAPDWRDPFWIKKYKKARDLGCDLVRLTRPALSMNDNLAIQLFREKVENLTGSRIPLISYNTGHLGRFSLCFNETLTGVTHDPLQCASTKLESFMDSPDPCVTTHEATSALYASFVFDPMKIYVIGASAGYSLSPAMHNAAYKAFGMPHNYQTHQTPSLNSLRTLVNDPYFGGASVSLPFKLEVISLTHSLSRHARAIGAVNTLIPVRHLRPDGSIPDDISLFNERNRAGPVKALYGENTDWIGIRACIRRGLSPANAVKPKTSGVVIGAGGMARAAVYAMLHLGVKNIVIFNRTLANAIKLVVHFTRLVSGSPDPGLLPSAAAVQDTQSKFHILESREDPWPEGLRFPTIIVSCIPTHRLGEKPAPNFTFPTQWIKSPTGGVLVEIAYRTLKTPLLEQFRAAAHQGWICMDGLDLLPEQGFAQFELFTGRRAPRRLMREEVLRCYRDEEGQSDLEVIQTRLDHVDDQEP
ncbi:hypothetical protein K432DRAFT_413046 [Lepidopterella palustris CBS 459.81]|uniref:Quinate repressor protein n=1 Tax=Lepidopterella palustris CBS 459.81 TaxID=1314670 RepID=A0A8E2JKH6_9PEZI|nr:hypothetical protein K432DRAFT_413046 [Lepidopterella palustris CBS 459.81]